MKYDATPSGDRRLQDSRETAISVKILLEKSSNGCRGRGPKLLVDMYLSTVPVNWEKYSEKKKRLIRKTEKRFRSSLIAAGFLPDSERRDLP